MFCIPFQVFACLPLMFKDERNFEDPESFRPERFLNEKTGEFVPNEKLIPFGFGKRRCPGEILARAEYFLFVTILLQTFKFEAVGPADLSTNPGLLFTPKPFEVRLTPRA